MIDNFERISGMLVFDSEDEFYHLQIIKRKKDNPEIGSNSIVVKTYYITSLEYLELKWKEIKTLCDMHNARACISLNRRSFEKMAFHVLRKVADQIMNKDYRSARKAYESVCGAYMSEKDKKWVIDIDIKDLSYVLKINEIVNKVEPIGQSKEYGRLETKNGYHLLTKPFSTHEFIILHNQQFPDIPVPDIQKNNPTILYIP